MQLTIMSEEDADDDDNTRKEAKTRATIIINNTTKLPFYHKRAAIKTTHTPDYLSEIQAKEGEVQTTTAQINKDWTVIMKPGKI